MSAAETGGPAFPGIGVHGETYTGITLRDYAAIHGNFGNLSAGHADVLVGMSAPHPDDRLNWLRFWAEAESKWRYMQADAMLEARK